MAWYNDDNIHVLSACGSFVRVSALLTRGGRPPFILTFPSFLFCHRFRSTAPPVTAAGMHALTPITAVNSAPTILRWSRQQVLSQLLHRQCPPGLPQPRCLDLCQHHINGCDQQAHAPATIPPAPNPAVPMITGVQAKRMNAMTMVTVRKGCSFTQATTILAI